MIWFKSKLDKAMIEALKKSKSEFNFDPNSVKHRLITSIEQMDQKPVSRVRLWRVGKYAVTFASFVLVLSVTFAFASSSVPGDKLFALNKIGEQVILNLPLSVEQKAKVQEYIVTSRLEALDQVNLKPKPASKKLDTKKLQTIKESDESLTIAVDTITANKKKLEASGKTKSAENLEKVLDDLQTQAEKTEAKIKIMEDETTDTKLKSEIQGYLQKIRANRQKAQAQIRRYNIDDK